MKSYLKFLTIIIVAIICLSSCGKKNPDTKTELPPKDTVQAITQTSIKKDFTLKDFLKVDKDLDLKTDSIFNTLTENQKIGQIVVIPAGLLGFDDAQVIRIIAEQNAGGIILQKGSKSEFEELIRKFKKVQKDSRSLPLIFSCDAEPSLINDKISGLPRITPEYKILSVEQSTETANQITKIIKDIGFQQNYAPVSDFSNNKEIIGYRSFGNETGKVSALSLAFVNATQEFNIAATPKHFPGHGNVVGDSHKGPVYIDGDIAELDVFKSVIDSGVVSIMVGHIVIKNNKEWSTDGLPSTNSRKIVTDLLKKKLGFKGIVITDAMNMHALDKFADPSLTAVAAGCDIVLMPIDPDALIRAVGNKMKNDKQFELQVFESIKKIIRFKICLGLFSEK